MHPPESYFTELDRTPDTDERRRLAERVFAQVFRTGFARPGFALIRCEERLSSEALRRFMITLKQDLGERYHAAVGRHLAYRSLSRFDQQNTTRFHLDGAPDESYLMLGYEPSEIVCEVWAADYSRAAHERALTPTEYLARYNPMHAPWEEQLLPYATQMTAFDPRFPQILLLNNSRLPYAASAFASQGVLHKATILTPQPEKSRIINSTVLISVENASEEPVSDAEQAAFVNRD